MADKPVLQISSAVVKQLGQELVPDAVTAIMELVKNAYDADADWVKITINTKDILEGDFIFKDNPGYIIIEDNGTGMTYDDIENRWLFISVSHKRQMKEKGETTPLKQRTPLGDKGLGRLSAQRLGNELEMKTGKDGESIFHLIGLNWSDFVEDTSLTDIDTHYETRTKGQTTKGTRLTITSLLDAQIWEGDEGDKFRGQLSKLIFPFKDQRPFNIYLQINGQSFDLDELNDRLREQAISQYKLSFDGQKLVITGRIKQSKLIGNSNSDKELYQKLISTDKGRNFYSFLTDNKDNKDYLSTSTSSEENKDFSKIKYDGDNGILFTFERNYDFIKDLAKYSALDITTNTLKPANPGSFYGELDEFNLNYQDSAQSAFNSLTEYKQLIKNQVGVRIFRDGFGISPYGMEDNDWLKLKKGQTSGGSFYTLRPENVVGFVSISAKDNKNLIEKTDRGGFLDNAYSKNFFALIGKSVDDINDILEKTRRSYIEFKKKDAGSEGSIQSYKDSHERIAKTGKEAKALKEETVRVFEELKSTSKEVKTTIKNIRSAPLFNKEEDHKSLTVLEEVDGLLDKANSLLNKINSILDSAQRLEQDANYLGPQMEQLENQIHQFSELAGLGITAEAFTHELYNILDRIGGQTDNILRDLKKNKESNTSFYTYTEYIKTFIVSIRRQLNHLAPSLKFNRETRREILLSEFAIELQEFYYSRFGKNIELRIDLKSDFAVTINKGKLTQVIDNIILNSEYWLNQRKKSEANFNPQITIEISKPFIIIYDNGFGIAPTLNDLIFQPFVTTKENGRGLGLFIVQQLLDSVNSDIMLLFEKNEFERRYKFQINLENLID